MLFRSMGGVAILGANPWVRGGLAAEVELELEVGSGHGEAAVFDGKGKGAEGGFANVVGLEAEDDSVAAVAFDGDWVGLDGIDGISGMKAAGCLPAGMGTEPSSATSASSASRLYFGATP